MRKAWPLISLGKVLTQCKEFIEIGDMENYKRCRVQLHAQGIILRDIVPGAEIKTKKQQVCKAGDFLVAEIDAKVGGFGIVPEELDGAIVSSHYFLFEIDNTHLDKRFLDYFICIPFFREQVVAQGSTNYAAIRPKDVLEYKIPLPSLIEQQRIVARIEEVAEKIEEAKELRKKAITARDGIISSNATYLLNKQSWPKKKLTDIVVSEDKHSIKRGPFGSSLRKEFFVPSGFKVYEQKNVIRNNFDIGNYYIDSYKFEELKTFQIKPGDVLITCSGTIGKLAIVPENAKKGIINQALLKLTLNEIVILKSFFKVIFESGLIQDQLVTPGSAMKNVSSIKHLKDIALPVPPLPEQSRIVEYLDNLQSKVNALKNLQAETQKELDALMPSILDKAFKGEF